MATIATLAVNMVAKTGAFTKGMKKARKSTNYFSRSLKQLAVQAATVFGAMRAYQFLKGSVALFGEQEKQVRSLSDALALLGRGGVSTMKDMQAFAVQMQNITVYGDELVLKMMALGASLSKLSGEDLKQATKSAIGLASVIKKDLATAMLLVARAAVGDTSMLTRYGIKISETLSKQEKFRAVLRLGAEGFVLATGEAETFSGSMLQLGNRLSDVREHLGEKLVPAILRLSGALKVFNNGIVDNAAKMLKWVIVIETGLFLGPRIVKMFTAIIKTLKLLAKAETVALAFGGQWAAIGVGLIASGAALGLIDAMFQGIEKDSEAAADAAEKMATAKAAAQSAAKAATTAQATAEAAHTAKVKANTDALKKNKEAAKLLADTLKNVIGVRIRLGEEISTFGQSGRQAEITLMEAVGKKRFGGVVEEYKELKHLIEATNDIFYIKYYGKPMDTLLMLHKELRRVENSDVFKTYEKFQAELDVIKAMDKELTKQENINEQGEKFRNIMKDVTEQLKTFGMDWLAKLKYRVQQLKDITKEQKDKFYDLLDQLKAKKAAAGMAGVLAGGEMRYIERPAFVDIRSSGQDQIQNRQLTELRRGNTLATEGNTALKEIGKQVWK